MAIDKGKVLNLVLTELAMEGFRYAQVGVSVKHVHLSEEDLHKLFGPGYQLHPMRDLVQPGQYAAKEQVTVIGPKGKIEKIRVIGPARKTTQVELGLTDALSIGMKEVPIRLSGDLSGTPGIKLSGPDGEVEIPTGTIVAARHLHVSNEEAKAFNVHDGMVVSIRTGGQRACILENVICRVGDRHELEFHVDTDEANSCNIKSGDLVEIIVPGQELASMEAEKKLDTSKVAERVIRKLKGISDNNDVNLSKNKELYRGSSERCAKIQRVGAPDGSLLDLVTERNINDAIEGGKNKVYCTRKALVTPSAADRARAFAVEIVKQDDTACLNVKPEPGREILELVTAGDLNVAFRDDRKEIYCTGTALITPAARERIEETGIRVIRVQEGK